MQPGVPAEAGSAKAVTQRQASQRQASQRQAAERPLPLPGSGADAFVRCRRGPKDRKAGTNAPSVADETRRSEDRQGTAPSGRVLAGKCPCRSVLRRKHLCESVTETSFAGSPLAGASFAGSPLAGASFAGSARAGGFSRERPCGRVPAKAPRKVPRKAPRVCPGSYCFGFGCAGRWLSSSSAASSAR